jgi:hypothetical protein
MMNNDIEEKYSVDSTNENGNNEDSKVQQRDSARTKDSSVWMRCLFMYRRNIDN